MRARRGRGPRSANRRAYALRGLLAAAAFLVALPPLLTLVYAWVNPPISALMLWRAVGGEKIDYRWVDLEQMAPVLPLTVITREDSRFCIHYGVDWEAMSGVIGEWQEGDATRGASTIAMQTAKNLFLWPQRSYLRKFVEIPLALWIDLVWSKRRVIEVYLNIAEWGPGIYGAEAAARHHFGTTAAQLSARQAGLLAAALPNPHERRAGKPGPLTRRLAAQAARRAAAAAADTGCLELK